MRIPPVGSIYSKVGFLAGFRGRLALLALLTILPAIALVIVTVRGHRQRAVMDEQQVTLRFARLAAAQQNNLISGTQDLLIAMAQVPAVQHADDRRSCDRLLETVQRHFALYTVLAVSRPNGDVVCNSIGSPSVNLADRPYFQRALATRGLAVSGYQIGRLSKKPSMVIAYPVMARGRLVYIFTASIDVHWLNRVAADAQLSPQSSLMVLDTNGVILARFPEGHAWIGKNVGKLVQVRNLAWGDGEGSTTVEGGDGRRYIFAFARLASTPAAGAMYMAIQVPEEEAIADARRLLRHNLTALSLLTILTAGLAWLIGDRLVVRPVRALATATKALARGEPWVPFSLSETKTELGQLAKAFGEMASRLVARETDLRTTAAALRETSQTLQGVINASPIAIVTYDVTGRVQLWNPAAERMFGWTREETVGRRPKALAPEDAVKFEAMRDRLARGETVANVETTWTRRDGRSLDLSVSTAPLHDSTGALTGTVVLFSDITETKRGREALQKSERLAALGRLAAGVGHELRNPLAVISGRLDLLRNRLDKATDGTIAIGARDVQPLANATVRMRRIMDGLSTYSKPPRPEPTTLVAQDLFVAIEQLVQAEARTHNVAVRLDLPENPLPFRGDRSQWMQILLNLGTNAVEAMAEAGGELALRVRPDGEGQSLILEVADTGPGMTAEQLERIWQPFYTTKPEGTGLGLSIVRSLVAEQPSATIMVESARGQGTVFRLTVPLAG